MDRHSLKKQSRFKSLVEYTGKQHQNTELEKDIWQKSYKGFICLPAWVRRASVGRICLCECEHRRIGSHQLYLSIIRVITQETRTQRAGQQLCMKASKHIVIHPPACFPSPQAIQHGCLISLKIAVFFISVRKHL